MSQPRFPASGCVTERCRGSLCQLRLRPADRCAQRASASPWARLLPGDARKSREQGTSEGKAAGNERSPAGRERRARLRAVPAALHQPPSLPRRTGTERQEKGEKGRKRGFLIPERCRGAARHHQTAELPPSEPEKAQSQAELPHRIRAQGQPAAPPGSPPAGTAGGTEYSHAKHQLWIPGAAQRDLPG